MCAFASLLHVARNFVNWNANNAPFSGETRLGSEIIIALMNENSIFNIRAKKFIIPFGRGTRAVGTKIPFTWLGFVLGFLCAHECVRFMASAASSLCAGKCAYTLLAGKIFQYENNLDAVGPS